MDRRTFITSALASASLVHSKLSWCDFSPAVTEPVMAARRVPQVFLNMRFDNFVVGAANQMAVASAKCWANDRGGRSSPLVIYGDVGTGKTHLVNAALNEIVDRNPRLNTHRVDGERFLTHMERARRQGAVDEFMRDYRSLDVLLFDMVQFLSKKPSTQLALQSVFDTLQKRNRRMLFVTDVHLKDTHGLSESLKSRLCSGLAVAIDQPHVELRRAILEHYAFTGGLEIQSEALDLIATRVKSCPRELEGWVKRFSAWSRFHGQPVTVGIVEAELQRFYWIYQ